MKNKILHTNYMGSSPESHDRLDAPKSTEKLRQRFDAQQAQEAAKERQNDAVVRQYEEVEGQIQNLRDLQRKIDTKPDGSKKYPLDKDEQKLYDDIDKEKEGIVKKAIKKLDTLDQPTLKRVVLALDNAITSSDGHVFPSRESDEIFTQAVLKLQADPSFFKDEKDHLAASVFDGDREAVLTMRSLGDSVNVMAFANALDRYPRLDKPMGATMGERVTMTVLELIVANPKLAPSSPPAAMGLMADSIRNFVPPDYNRQEWIKAHTTKKDGWTSIDQRYHDIDTVQKFLKMADKK